jgi:hypothetical protein
MMIAQMDNGAVVIGLTREEVETSFAKGPINLSSGEYPLPEDMKLVLMFGKDGEALKDLMATTFSMRPASTTSH